MSLPKDKAWFPAKTYGYGWGLPARWQGWIVLVAYVIALSLGSIFLTKFHPGVFLLYVVAITGLLHAICSRKGERAAWRWGKAEAPSSVDGGKKP